MRARPAHERPGERNDSEAAEADRSTRGGREAASRSKRSKTYSFVGERGKNRVLARSEDT